ncbi:MAG: hypothetical protein IJC83_05920 [Oscillospiraceae bacterium]|nr:hypothetical protein [Oscillospiraceae bacterium]
MFEFTASFLDESVKVGGQKYDVGQVITEALNFNSSEIDELTYNAIICYVTIIKTDDNVVEIRNRAKDIVKILERLDDCILSLPIIKSIAPADKYYKKIEKVISRYLEVLIPKVADGVNIESQAKMDRDANIFHKTFTDAIMEYGRFCSEIKLVGTAYRKLLDDFIHNSDNPPSPAQIARGLTEYFAFAKNSKKENEEDGFSFVPSDVNIEFSIDLDEKVPTMCERVKFKSYGAFLYYEFFKALTHGNIPKKCRNCGRYFLVKQGYFTEYCDLVAPSEKVKTCKEIGALKKFSEKVKNNPVWTIYQRTYKTRYARVSKGKMTKPEFEVWADNAKALREKALANEITLEEFQAAISQ